MLLLDRKVGQSVYVGNDVEVVVTVANVLPDGTVEVTLGFNAPRHINIDRKELRERRMLNMEKAFNGDIQ